MAATQYSDYYYNSTYYNPHHHQSQQQNVYGHPTGQYDCKNLNVNDAYSNYEYNSPNNYNDQWTQHYNAISSSHQHHQTQPHYHLNMLSNQINDDYKNYSYPSYNNFAASAVPKPIPPTSNEHHQPNLNCNQYTDRKNELFYGHQPTAPAVIGGKINEAVAASSSSYPSSQLRETKKRKIDTATADSPALRALLSKPTKRAKASPYFYHSQGSISPASSTDNYSQHYQLPSAPVVEEQLVNLNHYNQKEGYETSIDDIQAKPSALDGKFSASSLFAPSEATNSPMSNFMENISTPPSSPKDVNRNDESSDNLWNENGGLLWLWNNIPNSSQ